MHKRTLAVLLIGGLSVTTAGAATLHRLTVTQTSNSGSEGATTFLNTSASGGALQAEIGSAANTGIKLPFGLLGEYNPSGTTFGIGVAGISTTGYAVGGESLGKNPAILAENTGGGLGLQAVSNTPNYAAFEADAKGAGDGIDVVESSQGVGVYAQSGGSGFVSFAAKDGGDFYGGNTNGGYALLGRATGEGVVAYGESGGSAYPALSVSGSSGTDLIGVYGSSGSEEFLVAAGTKNASGHAQKNALDVDVSGDLYVGGELFVDCDYFPDQDPADDCVEVSDATTRSSRGDRVQMFSARQSAPTVEDLGTAQLSRGDAYVTLDPAFARTIDTTSAYMVFITPGGENDGLYVTNRSARGFEVRESHAGRSTLSFDYRIVAKPFGEHHARLASIARRTAIASRIYPNASADRATLAALRAKHETIQRRELPSPFVPAAYALK